MLLAVKITPLQTNSLFLCISAYFENRTLETQWHVLRDQDQLNFWSGGILFLIYLDSKIESDCSIEHPRDFSDL